MTDMIFGTPKIIKMENPVINGLTYIDNYITKDYQDELFKTIDKNEWDCSLKRRVQQYGYKYSYKSSVSMWRSNIDNYLGELPEFLKELSIKLVNDNYFSVVPEQVIINEYLPGQGIANHIDCVPCFGDKIASISLGCDVVMDFKNKKETKELVLRTGSLLLIEGDARYKWTHGIRPNKIDIIDNQRIYRTRRISLTFRNIK